LFRVVPVRPNRIDDLERVFATYDKAPFKIAAFIHELIMMNYGARVLTPQFIRRAYELSKACDAVTIDDEIQSCVWGPGMFTYKEYGIRPTAVIIGKGFPGGEYAGSRIVFDSDLDILPQFGALVTNGQEELASLAYLATIRWVEANQEPIEKIGAYFEQRVRAFADSATAVCGVDGCHHLLGIRFSELGPATDFASRLNKAGLDISVQTYKIDSPPTALIKLPLVCGYEFVDAVAGEMDRAMD
ncbi:MAG: aminotransferase class III-fold pyridoxal phosphate-dependent enzyme, partial [Lentisphaeria bacterium]|nr:aminotransferase class III-fold pyridoxal phosphate-dependent enzyme [Lentisphaeria bacterium]